MKVAGRRRIALVAGNGLQAWPFLSFSRIAVDNEIRLHAFESSVSPIFRDAGIGMAVYAVDPLKPGYMSGLERQLEEVDLVVAAGSENLASFQALRSCLKTGTPFHCISFETAPHVFDAWPNIRAIRHDILGRCDVTWTLDGRTREALDFEGYSVARVCELPFAPDRGLVLAAARSGRGRFRRHTGISADAMVVLYDGNPDPSGVAGHLVRAVKSLGKDGAGPANEKTRQELVVLVATPREGADAMKYLIADLGVARNFRFLHQDTAPFAFDLVASSDLWLLTESGNSSSALQLARMAGISGTRVALPVAAGQWGTLDASAFTLSDFSALALARMLKAPAAAGSLATWEASTASSGAAGVLFDDLFNTVLAGNNAEPRLLPGHDAGSQSWHQHLRSLESSAGNLRTEEILHEVEHLLLLAPPAGEITSRLNACKGDAQFATGNFEAATESFRAALAALAGTPFEDTASKESQQAARCYKALAQIAMAVHSWQESLDLFRRAHALSPGDVDACAGIGAVYRKLELYEEALHWLGRSVSEDHGSAINETALTAFMQASLACPDRPLAIRAVNDLASIIGEHPLLGKALDSLAGS